LSGKPHIKVTNDWQHLHTRGSLSSREIYLYVYPVSVVQGGRNGLIDGKSKKVSIT